MNQFQDLGEIEPNEPQYADDQVDEVIGVSQVAKFDHRGREAVKRIEQANLYLALLNHPLFSANSARPEIITVVEAEIKEFILSRLETLLGTRPTASSVIPTASPFSSEQTEALKAIADRLTKKETKPSAPSPQIRPVEAPVQTGSYMMPAIQTVSPPEEPEAPRQAKRGRPKKEIVIRPPTPEEGNLGSDGTAYAQAGNPAAAKMPSAAAMEALNSASVNKFANSAGSGGSGKVGALLMAAIAASQQKNKDITEE